MLYNLETLNEYCNNNNIHLTSNYSNSKINRETYISGFCLTNNCNNIFNKKYRQLIISGGYCSLCTNKNSSDKIKNKKVIYNKNYLLEYVNNNSINIIGEYDYVNRDTNISYNCINNICNKIYTKSFREVINLGAYCSDCSLEIGKNKIKETNLKKYGCECVLLNNNIQNKIKDTINKNYGVEYPTQSFAIKQKIINTNLKKRGVKYTLQDSNIKEQIKTTNIIKYGVDNPQKNLTIKEKTKNTNFKKYGEEYYLKTNDFKIKTKLTNLKKYGVEHHSQNSEIAEKMLNNSYNKKTFQFPSGKIINCQGYEVFALYDLINKEMLCETDIIVDRKLVPKIWYTDSNDIKHRHFVDIYIPSQNRCIEVKSNWTNNSKNYVLEKQQAGIGLGLNYEIWIYDKKGNKIIS
jgi:hypothetical protein